MSGSSKSEIEAVQGAGGWGGMLGLLAHREEELSGWKRRGTGGVCC